MVIEFNEEKEERRLKQLREQEEEDAMHILSDKYGLPYVDLTTVALSPDALITVSEEAARRGQLAVFAKAGSTLSVGVHAPDAPETQAVLKDLEERGFKTTLFLASRHSLQFVWERYKDVSFTTESKKGLLDVSNEEITRVVGQIQTFQDVEKVISNTLALNKAHRISEIVEVLLGSGLGVKASDIHIEPEETSIRVRMRLDGVLQDVAQLDADTYRLVLSRLKLLSGLKLNIAKEAQDGRFSIHFGDAEIEIRTSVLPGQYGESIVMRILNPDTISVDIGNLGMRPDFFAVVEQAIDKPNGIVLTTGPTGSGKTTTLYAFIKKVHNAEVKIITIEDPIEYHLKGVVQTQVDAEREYTFSSGLRAAMRQDPDIILVGEIRDSETAEIAIHAALTGHLVFSTLHTNSAAGSFTRLIDLGINPRILGSAINLAIAQRLVRTLCESCKKQVPLEGDERATIERVLGTVFDKTKIANVQTEHVWHAGDGCDACNNVGYKGRIGIYEGIVMDASIEDVVETSPSEREIKKSSGAAGNSFHVARRGHKNSGRAHDDRRSGAHH
jgi:type IV pilus assembly protein PilB